MEWSIQDLGALGEFVGSAAVLITLIYLALQIRQTNENAQASVEGQMGMWWSEHNREMILSKDMIEVIEKGLNEMDSLADPERRRFSWWLASLFYMFDNLFKQYQRGVLSEQSWSVQRRTIAGFMQNEAVTLWWESGFFQASPQFAAYVDKLRQNQDDADWAWVDIARIFDAVESNNSP